ncbi:MAG TPA: MAPEG family protein [Candidatus Binataceae bacterium]|nr:MAPEG family protein [Candidatus Binataceae bacterium]
MNSISFAIILALIEYSAFSMQVGRMRVKHGIQAPAVSGHPEFERWFRVQQNTLESLIVFIPALVIFGFYVHSKIALVLALGWIVARALYARGYVEDPAKRSTGAALTFAINVILLLGGLIGVFVFKFSQK